MNLWRRLERLEDQRPAALVLSEDERKQLSEFDQMGSDHPEYDIMLHLELYVKSRPGVTFEQLLAESLLTKKEAV